MTNALPTKWRELAKGDLKALREVNESIALDPHLMWWDLTDGRNFTPKGRDIELPVLIGAAKNYLACFVPPGDKLVGLLNARVEMQLGLAAIPAPLGVTLVHSTNFANQVLFGVIDDGCAFLNKCFCNEDRTYSRVELLWEQGAPPPSDDDPYWFRNEKFPYGRHLRSKGFDAALATANSTGEVEAYRQIGYLIDAAGEPLLRSHGTHITSIAAGRIVSLLPDGDSSGITDAAANTPIVAVHLPPATVQDTSGRSLCVHVVSGIQFIMSRATEIDAKAVVINLSLGIHAGPHDGSSLLERAIAAEVDKYKGRLIVVTGAGNGFEADIHAHAGGTSDQSGASGGTTLAQRETRKLYWSVSPDDPTDSFLELWTGSGLEVRLTTPQDDTSEWVAAGQRQLWRDDGVVLACVSSTDEPPNGAGRLIHLALAPTWAADGGPVAPAGVWVVEIRNVGAQPVSFDAWIDRDDAPYGAKTGRRYASRLLDVARDDGQRLCSARRTMNGLADPAHMLVAAAATMTTQTPARYSASGEGRGGASRHPTAAFAADESPVLQGMPGAGVISGQMQRMNGTSVATALLSREALNFLAAISAPPEDQPSPREALIEALRRRVQTPGTDPARMGMGYVATELARLR